MIKAPLAGVVACASCLEHLTESRAIAERTKDDEHWKKLFVVSSQDCVLSTSELGLAGERICGDLERLPTGAVRRGGGGGGSYVDEI